MSPKMSARSGLVGKRTSRPHLGPGHPRDVFPANPDLVDILGTTDLDFKNVYLLDWIPNVSVQDFQTPRFGKLGNPEVWKSGHADFGKSGNPDVRNSENPDLGKSEHSDFLNLGIQKLRI